MIVTNQVIGSHKDDTINCLQCCHLHYKLYEFLYVVRVLIAVGQVFQL